MLFKYRNRGAISELVQQYRREFDNIVHDRFTVDPLFLHKLSFTNYEIILDFHHFKWYPNYLFKITN